MTTDKLIFDDAVEIALHQMIDVDITVDSYSEIKKIIGNDDRVPYSIGYDDSLKIYVTVSSPASTQHIMITCLGE